MELSTVTEQIRTFVTKTFKIDAGDSEFNDDIHLFDYGYVDSFGAVEIINYIQDKFNIEISNKDLVIHPLNTIKEISTLVHQRIGDIK